MTFRGVVLLSSWGLLLPFACGPDPEPQACGDGPDFDVVITASGGELPGDTTVLLTYGSGREEYRLSHTTTPQVLFCTPTDEDGQPLETGEGGAPGAAGAGGAAGSAGAGGGKGATSGGVPALHCTIWTQGPATIEIVADGYPEYRQELQLQRGKCTIEEKIALVPEADAGT